MLLILAEMPILGYFVYGLPGGVDTSHQGGLLCALYIILE